MNKSDQPISVPTDAINGAIDTHHAALPGKGKILRTAWVLALSLSIVGWVTVALFLEKTTWIDADGFLYEPLFGLIPISYFFLFVAVVLAVFDMALKLRKRKRPAEPPMNW